MEAPKHLRTSERPTTLVSHVRLGGGFKRNEWGEEGMEKCRQIRGRPAYTRTGKEQLRRGELPSIQERGNVIRGGVALNSERENAKKKKG